MQGVQELLNLSASLRWPQTLRVAALQACYNAVPVPELPGMSAATAALAPSEQLLAATRLGAHRCIDPYRASGARLTLPLWDPCSGAFATRVVKLTEKLAAAVGPGAPRKIRALSVDGRRITAWPGGISMLDALRHLDWREFLDAHATLALLSPAPASRAQTPGEQGSRPALEASDLAPACSAGAPGLAPHPKRAVVDRPVAAAAAGATGGELAAVAQAARGGGVRVAGRARVTAVKARDAAGRKAAQDRIAAAVAGAQRAAREFAAPRNTIELQLESFTDEEVRRWHAVDGCGSGMGRRKEALTQHGGAQAALPGCACVLCCTRQALHLP